MENYNTPEEEGDPIPTDPIKPKPETEQEEEGTETGDPIPSDPIKP